MNILNQLTVEDISFHYKSTTTNNVFKTSFLKVKSNVIIVIYTNIG